MWQSIYHVNVQWSMMMTILQKYNEYKRSFSIYYHIVPTYISMVLALLSSFITTETNRPR